MNSTFDPYRTLEIDKRASDLVIKAAYHALIGKHHPDKGGSEKIAKQVNEAYQILSDDDKRREYDREHSATTGTVIGNYKILEEIAEGGFGITYKGEHTMTKDLVCIKHCSQVSAAHDAVLIQETKAIWDLRHYAMPVMRDLARLDDGSLALVMSYIPGPTLEKIVDKVGKMDPETVAWITDRILNALLYLHHHGVIHGDIKPQNIIIQPESHSVVLVDFGLAMVKPTAKAKSIGYTEVFAPPEQVEAVKKNKALPLLPSSDYYSLGMLMTYALNGGKDMEKKRVPASVPDPMVNFIASITRKNILERPQDDLFDEFVKVRQASFGRTRSGMRNIPGFNS